MADQQKRQPSQSQRFNFTALIQPPDMVVMLSSKDNLAKSSTTKIE